jgi:hypothetical protein
VWRLSSDLEVSYTVLGQIVLIKLIKKPIEFLLYRLFLWSSPVFVMKYLPFVCAVLSFGLHDPTIAQSFEAISLKKYKIQANKVDNPVDLSRLALNKTFQINSPDFVLQFFFSGPDILGIIFKRNLKRSLFVRWCFFRTCEESPFDYVSVIGQSNSPPLANGFFEIKHPPGLNYHFQGLHFFTRN